MAVSRSISSFNRVAYAVGDFYGGGGLFLVSTFAMFFLVNVAHLGGAEVGLLFGLSKLWDAFCDPFTGWLSDRTHSRFGRRRLYFLIGLLPIFLSFVLIFYPVPISGHQARFLYYLGAYIFFYTVAAVVQIPYAALSADMSEDPRERNALVGTRLVFSMTSTLIIALLAQPFIDSFHDASAGHRALGIAGGLFCSLPFILVFLGTWELPQTRIEGRRLTVFANFFSIFRNRAFLVQLGMYVAAFTAMDILTAWLKFYVYDYLRMPGFLSVGLGLLIVAEIASVGLYKNLVNRRGGGFAYALGLGIMAAGMLLLALQNPAEAYSLLSLKTVMVGLNCAIVGFGLGAGVFVPYALMPYSIDADELITGQKRSGTYAGGMLLFRKLVQGAIVMPLLGFLLDAIGYQSGAGSQGEATLSSMHLIFVGLPLAFIAAGLLVCLAFTMTPDRHKQLVGELNRLRSGGRKADADPRTIQLCERLTGRSWSELWIPEKER